MGSLNTRQKYIYQVSSVNNIEANLNSYLGMRFYDTGLTTNENVKIYYNEANTLAIWGYIIDGEAYWRITTIVNIGNQNVPTFAGPFTPINSKPIGTYEDFFNESDPPPNSTLVISEISSKLKISIKKQNLTSLKVGGGTTVNNPSSVYVFKGGSINTLADIFNPINFQVNDTILITSLELFLNDDYDFLFQVDDYGAGKYWTNDIYAQTNMNNYVIPVNYIIYFNTSNNNNIQVSNGAIIQKYNSGKIQIKNLLRAPSLSIWALLGPGGPSLCEGGWTISFNSLDIGKRGIFKIETSIDGGASIVNTTDSFDQIPSYFDITSIFTDFSNYYIIVRLVSYNSAGVAIFTTPCSNSLNYDRGGCN